MIRASIVLTALLVICALGLITSQNRARRLFVELGQAEATARQLEVQWDRLELEQTALAKTSLIDSKARRHLSMQTLSADRTLHLNLSNGVGQAAMNRAEPRRVPKGAR